MFLFALLCLCLSAAGESRRAASASNGTNAIADDPSNQLYDAKHGVKMGVKDNACDDAKSSLEVDWSGSPVQYTCYNPQRPLLPDRRTAPRLHCDNVPDNYYPKHFCMSDRLTYNTTIPTHGDHRPLWPKYGEYKYVPLQRWLHTLEHGGLVMLYHPCTHHKLVDKLRQVVNGCIRKRVITPYGHLSPERPLALVAWGCRYEMAFVDKEKVVHFIRSKALHGPEGHVSKEGQYDFHLLEKAEAPQGSDFEDTVLCPNN